MQQLFKDVDVMVTPTCPTTYTIADVAQNNIERNAMMGTYTNFVNLLDLPAISVSAGFRNDGKALGTMLIGPFLGDTLICQIGVAMHEASGLCLGATQTPVSALTTSL